MYKKLFKNNCKSLLLKSLFIFIILSLIYLSGAIFINSETNSVHKREVITNEERLIDTEKTIISNKMDNVIGDILYVSDSLSLYDDNSSDKEKLLTQLVDFSNRRKVYDQIRFIDLDGNEKIRINYSENGAYVTPENELQNKKDRYYFNSALPLNENQIYISDIDLNVENNMVETPIKPMMRIATPFYDKNKVLEGIVVLNYYANDIIKEVKNAGLNSMGKMYIVNSDGYWIYNSEDETKEWTFMYDDKKDISFKNEFSNEWNKIVNNSEGSFTTENGFFTYSKTFYDEYITSNISNCSLVFQSDNRFIVSKVSKDDSHGYLFYQGFFQNAIYTLKRNILVLMLILLLSVIIAGLMILNKISRDKITYYSEYDVMTGIFNRRAGFEKLNNLYKDAVKNGGKISVCFIDINGLKDVNDTLGHEAGDQLILSIISGIKLCIRNSDFISRLGGDEFLIVFKDIDKDEAETIWQRIKNEYKKINDSENRKYVISASHGIEEFSFNSNEYIDTIINTADEKMYDEKRIIKKDFKAIR